MPLPSRCAGLRRMPTTNPNSGPIMVRGIVAAAAGVTLIALMVIFAAPPFADNAVESRLTTARAGSIRRRRGRECHPRGLRGGSLASPGRVVRGEDPSPKVFRTRQISRHGELGLVRPLLRDTEGVKRDFRNSLAASPL